VLYPHRDGGDTSGGVADRAIANGLLQWRAGLGMARGDGFHGSDSCDNDRLDHDVAAAARARPVPAALSGRRIPRWYAQLSRIKAVPPQLHNSRNTLSIQGQAQGAQW